MSAPCRAAGGTRGARGAPASMATLALVAALLAGCGVPGLYGVPLPGGPDTGEHPYRVVAYFGDVLDLVPQANVKVNDVAVGRVERIEATTVGGGYAARVTMVVNASAVLPANAEAAVRQTSLLGEKFVELRGPASQPRGRLTDGAEIPIERTGRNTEVEELLGALSMLLNGGGIGQVQGIVRELNAALAGNEPQLRALLSDLDTFFAGLDAQRAEITKALEGLDALSRTLNGRQDELVAALDGLAAGLDVLAGQRPQLVEMLRAVERLGSVATGVIERSRDDVLADLRALQPVLTELADAGANLPKSLELLLTFPFPDNAVDAFRGDYANLDVTLDLDLREALANLASAQQPVPLPDPPDPVPDGPAPTDRVPLLPGLPGVPLLPLPGPEPAGDGGTQQPRPPGNIFEELLGLPGGGQR